MINIGIYLKDHKKLQHEPLVDYPNLKTNDWAKYSTFPIISHDVILKTTKEIEKELQKYILNNDNSGGQDGLKLINDYFLSKKLPMNFNDVPYEIQKRLQGPFSWFEARLAGSDLLYLPKYIRGLDHDDSSIQFGPIYIWKKSVFYFNIRYYLNSSKSFFNNPIDYCNLIYFNNSIAIPGYISGISPENKNVEDLSLPSDIYEDPKMCRVNIKKDDNAYFAFYGQSYGEVVDEITVSTPKKPAVVLDNSRYEKSKKKIEGFIPVPIIDIFKCWDDENHKKDLKNASNSNKIKDTFGYMHQPHIAKMQINLMKLFRYEMEKNNQKANFKTKNLSDLQKDIISTYAFIIHMPTLYKFLRSTPGELLLYKDELLVDSIKFEPPGNLFFTFYLPRTDKKYTFQKSIG